MQYLKRISTVALAVVAVTVLSGSASALAHGSTDDESTSNSTTSSQSARQRSVDPEKKAEFHQKAQENINQLQAKLKDNKGKNTEQRHKACESHKQGLTTKFSNISTKTEKFQARIDKALEKATSYKQTKGLNPENWDTLLDTAKTAQATSAASIADLEAITPTIDCNSTSVASDVATYKAAATTARDNIKAYRASVKALLKSLIDAKKSSATEGSQQ